MSRYSRRGTPPFLPIFIEIIGYFIMSQKEKARVGIEKFGRNSGLGMNEESLTSDIRFRCVKKPRCVA
jgi:hypothetical protein